MDEWISVKDEKPKKSCECIVTNGRGAWIDWYAHTRGTWVDYPESESITHWMLIPEQPAAADEKEG